MVFGIILYLFIVGRISNLYFYFLSKDGFFFFFLYVDNANRFLRYWSSKINLYWFFYFYIKS